MTVRYFAILTNQGKAALAKATASGTQIRLTHMVVGDGGGTLPEPDPEQTSLINVCRTGELNHLYVDENDASQIIAEQVIPADEGGFWIREMGLLDENGELFAVANCPEAYKPQLSEGSGRTLTIRMAMAISNTAAVTLLVDPSVVLATRQYVDEKTDELRTELEESISGKSNELREELENSISGQADQLRKELEGLSGEMDKLGEDLQNKLEQAATQDASTSRKGVVRLSNDTNSDSEELAATPKAVKAAFDRTKSVEIPADSNFNNLATTPMMFIGGGSPPENHPMTSGSMNDIGGLLWSNPRSGYPAQIFINYEGRMFTRVQSNAGWRPWHQVGGAAIDGYIGTYLMSTVNTAVNYMSRVAGSQLSPARAGTWCALGSAGANGITLFQRVA